MENAGIGLYLHVPFCAGKCPYCDFYSVAAHPARMDEYVEAMLRAIALWGGRCGRRVDTVYFGGGTPGILGDARLCRLLEEVSRRFQLDKDAEVTVELNPTARGALNFQALKRAGVNRISVGLQSAGEEELRLLGRRHTAAEAAETVERAAAAGISNCSLDLMLGLPGQTAESIRRSAEFCRESGARHVSAYLLKIEPGTVFHRIRDTLALPDEDGEADCYLAAVEALEGLGYRQYEISNFAQPGCESRHNLKYWNAEEYLGLGPAAHSFYEGRRFYTPASLQEFCRAPRVLMEEEAGPAPGSFEEYAMLRLRLSAGLQQEECLRRFGRGIPPQYRRRAAVYEKAGFLALEPGGIRFTPKGFLVSNSLTAAVLYGG
jgi:oxygen-independent coproporphyrinogen-3 oxidase